ncbi:MAG: hypothetical protein CVU78_07965 [Elusimicrobia bacterium HGW-Elusimicrobia-2]|nr:MAG: hypothetical protein CVU78_07965 [Elusimicrobia bacterium HGW-Elusimicrobia-2]
MTELKITTRDLITAVAEKNIAELESVRQKILIQISILLPQIIKFAIGAFPFIAFLTILLLMYANRATTNKNDSEKSFLFLSYIAFVHIIIAIIKIIPFLFFILPGIYVYVKLLFVSLIMLEKRCNAPTAVKLSWKITSGHFWKLFLLVFINSGIQLIVLPTIIGEIPATGFVNTARAAAFRIIWENPA